MKIKKLIILERKSANLTKEKINEIIDWINDFEDKMKSLHKKHCPPKG